MAVDGLGVCLNQNQAFIGRHDIVIKVLDGAVAGCFHIKNSCDFFSRFKWIFDKTFAVTADLGIVLTVQHRSDTSDSFSTISSIGYVFDGYLLRIHRQQAHKQNNKYA